VINSKYAKAVVALIAAVATAVAAAVGNGQLDDLDGAGWVKVALVVLGGTAATWWTQNVPGLFGGVIKAVMAAATAGLTALSVAYENDGVISQGEYLTAVAATLVALAATYQVPNTGEA
jgi:hypothetical protein